MKPYLESNQGPTQLLLERKQTSKAKIPKIYYGKLHIDCYHFCQKGNNYFKTAGASGANRTLFAASFFCRNISVRWA